MVGQRKFDSKTIFRQAAILSVTVGITAITAAGLADKSAAEGKRKILGSQSGSYTFENGDRCYYTTTFYSDGTWKGNCGPKSWGRGTYTRAGNDALATTKRGRFWRKGTNRYSRVKWR